MRRAATWLACAVALATFGAVAGQDKPVPPPAPRPAVKPAPAADGNNAAVAQWEQQFGPQIRQLFRFEMHFMRLVCEPTRAQYAKIAADSEAAVQAATRRFAESLQAGGWGDQTDPRPGFADAIAKSVRAGLAPEQAARYDKELELRRAARKRFNVWNVVAAMDQALVLSADQRGRLGEALTAYWDEYWNKPQMIMYGFIPQVPDATVVPLLTDAQRAAWPGVPKVNPRNILFLGFGHGVRTVDDEWDDNPAPKAPRAPEPDAKDAEPRPAPARAANVAVPVQRWTDEEFERWAFNPYRNAAGARERFEAVLPLQIDDIDRACRLDDGQRKKLQLAGRGDIRRLFESYDRARSRFNALNNDFQRLRVALLDIRSLPASIQGGPFTDDSLLAKSLRNTLTAEQFARYEAVANERRAFRHRAHVEMLVTSIEKGVALSDAQRWGLIVVLTREIRPLRASDHFAIYRLVGRFDRVAEGTIRSLLSDAQWKAVGRQLADYRVDLPNDDSPVPH